MKNVAETVGTAETEAAKSGKQAHREYVGNTDRNALFDVVMALLVFCRVPLKFTSRVHSICGHGVHTRHVRVVLHGVAEVKLGTTHADEVDDHLDLEAETDHAHDNSCNVYMAWRDP